MFFKRTAPPDPSFDERLDALSGFDMRPTSGGRRVARGRIAALVANGNIERIGLALGEEIGVITDIGYQKVFLTPSGRRVPATAEYLRELHAFREDLAAALGLESLYNEGLGSVNTSHHYDRVSGRR
jgi:hypothetical protein